MSGSFSFLYLFIIFFALAINKAFSLQIQTAFANSSRNQFCVTYDLTYFVLQFLSVKMKGKILRPSPLHHVRLERSIK